MTALVALVEKSSVVTLAKDLRSLTATLSALSFLNTLNTLSALSGRSVGAAQNKSLPKRS